MAAAGILITSAFAATALPAAARAVAEMDIAGVTLGMAFETSIETLEAARYDCRQSSGGLASSFEEEVSAQVDRRNGKNTTPRRTAVRQVTCKRESGEHVELVAAHPRGGAIVDSIRMLIPTPRFSKDDVLAQITQKYGQPAKGTISDGMWCDNANLCPSFALVEHPAIRTTTTAERISIQGTRGKLVRDAEEALIAAEADRRQPAKVKAAL